MFSVRGNRHNRGFRLAESLLNPSPIHIGGEQMKTLHHRALTIAVALGLLSLGVATSHGQSQTIDPAKAIGGAWTLNKDLSDKPAGRPQDGEQGNGRRRQGGSGRSGGFGRRGGGAGGVGGAGTGISPDDRARVREAMRDVLNPPDRLTIVQTNTTVIITAGDGRVVRLATDGTKVKDDSTKIERKTKWDGNKLVSEIGGVGAGKITETYVLDPERKQLRVTVQMDNGGRPTTLNRV